MPRGKGHVVRFAGAGVTRILAPLIFAALLLAFPREAASGAADGVGLCLNTIVPSLYPFMCLSSYLVRSGLCSRAGKLLGTPARVMFGLGGDSGAAIIMGQLCGYPVGVRTAAQMARRGDISPRDARAAALFCVSAGPAFILGTVGGELLGSRAAGRILFASCLLASLTAGVFTRLLPLRSQAGEPEEKKAEPPSAGGGCVLADAVADASRAMLSVCAWVVLFGCAASLFKLLPESMSGAVLPLCCVAEVTGGCRAAIGASLPLPVSAALLGWSGLCVQCQLMPYVKALGLRFSVFMAFRALCGALSAAYCGALLRIFRPGAETFLTTAAPAFRATSFSAAASAGLLLMGAILILQTDFETR